MERNTDLVELAFMIIILGVSVSIGATILINYGDAVGFTGSSEETFIYNSTKILSPRGLEITSNQILTYNQTWLNFDGEDDYVDLGNPSSINTTENFTMMAWIYSNNLTTSTRKNIMAKGVTGAFEWNFATDSSEGINGLMFRDDNGVYLSVSSTEPIEQEEWYHASIVLNGSTIWLYVNGELNATDLSSAGTRQDTHDADIYVGSRETIGSDLFWNGSIDEIRIYNRTLTSAEILEIYNSGRTPNASLPSDGLNLWLSFNENQGTTSYDKTTLGNNGTIDGAVYQTDSINLSLTEDTDYTLSETSGLLTLLNPTYSISQFRVSWFYAQVEEDYEIANDAATGLAEYGNWFGIIVIVGIASTIIALILISFSRREDQLTQNY